MLLFIEMVIENEKNKNKLKYTSLRRNVDSFEQENLTPLLRQTGLKSREFETKM